MSKKNPKKRIRKKHQKLQEAIKYATQGKQSLNPINVEDVIFDNASEVIQDITPEFLTNKYDELLKVIYTRQDAQENNWNYYWTAKKDQDRYILRNLLNTAIQREKGDEKKIIQRIENSAVDIIQLANRIVHDSGGKGGEQLQADYQTFINIILGRTLSASEAQFVAENLEQLQSQTLEDYLEDDLGRANPLTGRGLRK